LYASLLELRFVPSDTIVSADHWNAPALISSAVDSSEPHH
jgi:hypothetical protein